VRPSRFNIFQPWRGRWVALNSVSWQAALVDLTAMTALKSGQLENLPQELLVPLARLGLVVEDEVDEAARVLHTAWPERTADVTVVLDSPSAAPAKPNVDEALAYILRCWQDGDADQVKLRLCGRSSRSVAERRAVLGSALDICQRERVRLVSMWMTDRLEEAPLLGGVRADAFFFRWDLGRAVAETEPDGEAWTAIRDLVGRGKSVALQLAVSDFGDIDRQADCLQWLARQPALARAGNCLWDLTIGGDRTSAYFLPNLCLEEIDPAYAQLPVAREQLARLGIRVRPAASPYRIHPGCPFRWPLARTYDRDGHEVRCLLEFGDGRRLPGACERAADGEGFEPLDAAPLREQIARCGTECAYLPLCLARCPRIGALEPGSGPCAKRKRLLEQELYRILATRQMLITNLVEGPGSG